jgi:hypothetical protein
MALSNAQKAQLLYSAARIPAGDRTYGPAADWEAVFSTLQNNQRLTLDLGAADLIWYPEPIRLWADLLRGNSSKLRKFMHENDTWPLLVADSDLPARESLFVVRPLQDVSELLPWTLGAQWANFAMRVQSLGPDFLVAVFSLNSFIV